MLTVIKGPVDSGKAEIVEKKKAKIERENGKVIVFRPTAFGPKDGEIQIGHPREIIGKIGTARAIVIKMADKFSPQSLNYFVEEVLFNPYQGQDVIVSGLDKDLDGSVNLAMESIEKRADMVITTSGECSTDGCHSRTRQSVLVGKLGENKEEITLAIKGVCKGCYAKKLENK